MSTEYNYVIQSMSKVSIPQDILSQVDMQSLLKGLSDDYDKLDNLKNARAHHEDRNALSRWWNNNELEDAQLDAAELQASFSKKLGQLMVISVVQSQQLNQQQTVLSNQQHIIKQQTEQLAENDENLKNQQLGLENQNNKLEKLVNDYFELKGLTQDGALKLIKIASEVKETKDSLIESFSNKAQEVDNIRLDMLTTQSKFREQQIQEFNAFINKADQSLEQQQQRIEQRIKQVLSQVNRTDEQLQLAMKKTEECVTDALLLSQRQQEQQQSKYDSQWQEDRTKILASLSEHQRHWETEVQEQNNQLVTLQADNNQLQIQLNEQAQQHSLQLEELHPLLDSLKLELETRDIYWHGRWKMMTRTVTGALVLLAVALGYITHVTYS